MRFRVLSLVICAGFSAGQAIGQETRGWITGRVVDSSEALIPAARVDAINTAQGTTASSVTNQSGSFEIPYLLPGMYRIVVEAQGFKRLVREGIQLRVNDRLLLNLTLEVGDVSESVNVTAEAPLLETATATTGLVMGQRQVTELPVVGGNAFYLSRLTAGVVSATGRGNGQNPFDGGSSSTTIIVNGTRSGSSEVTLDGAPNMFNNSTAYAPPQDLVQEFKINTAAYDASQGHAAGAVVNVSLKSGTNEIHGTGYLFDSRLRARPWFLNRFLYDDRTGPITDRKIQEATPGWLHQRWGVTFTGPVSIPKVYEGRNRTFWSFGYEGVKVRRETTFFGTLPTTEQKRGDFSALLAAGPQYQIYDPATIAPAPGGRFSRQPLPGNIVPASRINPIAASLLSFYPDANSPGTADGRQNFFRIAQDDRLWGSFLGRVDHNISEKHRIFVRVNANTWETTAQQMPTIANGNINRRPGYGFVMDDVYVFNPQLLLNVRYSLTNQSPSATRISQGFDLLSLSFPQGLVNEIASKNNMEGVTFPQVVIDSGAYTDLGANGGNRQSALYHTIMSTLTKVTGSHSIRAGADLRLMREFNYNFGNVSPRFDFSNTFTRGPLDNSPAAPIGQGLASMLFGVPSGGVVNINASLAQQSTFTAFFLQDDWKVTRKLTINLGLRWEYEGPTTERYNRSIRGFDEQTVSPIQSLARTNYARSPMPELPIDSFQTLGGLTFAAVNGEPRRLWTPDRNNFAPRIGLAYQVASRTVIRAGYGIFYDLIGVDRQDVNQGGFNQPTNIIPSLNNGQTFIATLTNPFPSGLETPVGAGAGASTFLGRGISFFAGEPLNAYMQRWSLSVQRELPGRFVSQLSYVGNRGSKISTNRDLNAIPAQHLSTLPMRDQPVINYLSAQVQNPFFGIREFAGSPLAAQRVARNQLLRPMPHFGAVSVNLPAGFSYYHSMQVEVEKRFSRGFSLQTSWTFSKFMEGRNYLNHVDNRVEKVISDQDYPHRFVVSAIYELPFGKGKPLMTNAQGFLDHLISGWQLQGWFEGQTGQALGFGNALFTGSLQNVPIPVGDRRAEHWFNTDAGFERDPRVQLANNLRAFSTRFNGIRSDGINNFDLSIFKNFQVREGFKLQFRFETYNSLNHVQFGNPNTTPTNSAFGQVTSEKGHGQRQATLALKAIF